jgi:hypothetical protein
MGECVRSGVAVTYPAMIFGPNKARRDEAREFLRDIEKEMGGLSLKERLFCLATIPLSLWTWLTTKLNILQQPKLLRIQHPVTPSYRPESKSVELKSTSPLTFPGTGSTCPICSCAVESENVE